MVGFNEKNTANGYPSARIFDAEIGHFTPILQDSVQFHQIVVKFSLFAGSKRRRIRLNLRKSACCAVQKPIEDRLQ